MKWYQHCDVGNGLTDAIWRLLVGVLNFNWNTNQGDLICNLTEPEEVLSLLTGLVSEKSLGIDLTGLEGILSPLTGLESEKYLGINLTGFVSFDWIGLRKIFRN